MNKKPPKQRRTRTALIHRPLWPPRTGTPDGIVDEIAALIAREEMMRTLLAGAEVLFACRCYDATSANWLDNARAALAPIAAPAQPAAPSNEELRIKQAFNEGREFEAGMRAAQPAPVAQPVEAAPKPDFDLAGFDAALRRAAASRGFDMKQLSGATGVSETTLSRMHHQCRRPDAASLAALSAWAGINPANYSAPPAPPCPRGLQEREEPVPPDTVAWFRLLTFGEGPGYSITASQEIAADWRERGYEVAELVRSSEYTKDITSARTAGRREGLEEATSLDTPERVRFYEHDFYVLSNFSAFSLLWKGIRFDTSEAAYHWEKFEEHYTALRHEIATAPSAHEAFKLAERNKHCRRRDWDDAKVQIMREILRAKADQHEYVRRKLLATGERELVEDSWRDDFWGWGPNRDGKNMLGRLWMEVRAAIRALPDAQG